MTLESSGPNHPVGTPRRLLRILGLALEEGVAERLDTLLPDLRRCLVAEAGGFPAWEFPSRVNALVEDFPAEVDAARGAARADTEGRR